MAAVTQDGAALKYAAEELQCNRDIVLAAVRQDGAALLYAAEELRRDPVIVLAAVSADGLALKYAATELKSDANIVLRAYAGNRDVVLTVLRELGVGELGRAARVWELIDYLTEEHRKYFEIVLALVSQNGLALRYAAVELQSNHDIVLAAVRQDGVVLKYAAEELQSNRDIVLAAVRTSPLPLVFAADSLLQEEGFAEEARKHLPCLGAHAWCRFSSRQKATSPRPGTETLLYEYEVVTDAQLRTVNPGGYPSHGECVEYQLAWTRISWFATLSKSAESSKLTVKQRMKCNHFCTSCSGVLCGISWAVKMALPPGAVQASNTLRIGGQSPV
eukprot:2541956-Amphidinium_carterae.1